MENIQSRRLIFLYKVYKCLWDPTVANYTNRGVRDDAWCDISRQMGNIPVAELKMKMRSLSGGYRREKYREKQSRITGSGAEDTYKSKWFAYDDFAFMADKNDPGTTQDTVQDEETDNIERVHDENSTLANNEETTITGSGDRDVQSVQSNVQITGKRNKNKRKKNASNNADDISDDILSEANFYNNVHSHHNQR